MKTLSVVIPAYNEEKVIGKTIDVVYDLLRKTERKFELIIADDGSNDSTYEIVNQKRRTYVNLKIVRNKINQGRGSVLKKAFKFGKGDYLIYIDADLAIDLQLFDRLISAMDNGADVTIGSKHMKISEVEYPPLRRLLSKLYAFLAGQLLSANIKDYQCGFKAFKKKVINSIIDDVKSNGWFWDTEILVRANWRGFNIVEMPAKVVNVYFKESNKKEECKIVKTFSKFTPVIGFGCSDCNCKSHLFYSYDKKNLMQTLKTYFVLHRDLGENLW